MCVNKEDGAGAGSESNSTGQNGFECDIISAPVLRSMTNLGRSPAYMMMTHTTYAYITLHWRREDKV